jgi:hypothetical protein
MMPNWAQFANLITLMNPTIPLMRPLAKMLNVDQPFWQLDQVQPHVQGTWLVPTPEVRPQAGVVACLHMASPMPTDQVTFHATCCTCQMSKQASNKAPHWLQPQLTEPTQYVPPSPALLAPANILIVSLQAYVKLMADLLKTSLPWDTINKAPPIKKELMVVGMKVKMVQQLADNMILPRLINTDMMNNGTRMMTRNNQTLTVLVK